MESAKRQRLDSVRNTSLQLVSLNQDCILKIFEYLELNELCAISKTCTKLQQIAELFFCQRFKKKMMTEVSIRVRFDRKIVVLPEDEYVTQFLKLMQNLKISCGYTLRPLDMVEFMRNKCNENLINISFEQIKFNKLHGAMIIDWLSTVEGLALFGCENLHYILAYCSNLKNLKIDQYSNDQSNLWMIQRYPTLEHLQYDMKPDQTLVTFLKNNTNVKSLALKFDNISTRVVRDFMRKLLLVNLEVFLINLTI